MARRAARGEGTIRQRKDGRWEYMYFDKAGERRSAYGASEADVKRKKVAIQAALQEGTYTDPSAYTVSTWADYFFDELYLQQNVDTRRNVRVHLDHHIKPFFKAMKLQDVSQDDVVCFNKYLIEKELATKTIKNIRGTLFQLFKSAIPKRIKVNPAAGVPMAEAHIRREMRVFTEDEQFAFEDALVSADFCNDLEKDLFLFALLTGLREGELLGLDWKHVDFETGTINIHQQLKRLRPVQGVKKMPGKRFIIKEIDESHYLAPPKHGIKRQLKPGKAAMDVLRNVERKQIETRLRTGLGPAYNPHGLVFVNGIGGYLVSRTLVKHFKRIVEGIGVPEMRIHDLRHTYSRNSLLAGNTYDQISEALGHSSVDFTKRIYGHFPAALHEKTGQNMDEYERKRQEKKAAQNNKKTQAT